MDLPLQLSPEDIKELGARDGRLVREAMDRILRDLDMALYRAFPDAQQIDLYQIQGAVKAVQKLRKALSQAIPAQFPTQL
jgi:hypothetical protein